MSSEGWIPPRRKNHRMRNIWGWLALLVICVMLGFGSIALFAFMDHDRPSEERVTVDFNGLERPVFYQGELLDYEAVGTAASLKLPYSLLKAYVDPLIMLEEASESVIVTTENRVVRFRTDQLTAMVNERPVELHFPLEIIDDEWYVPLEPLYDLYHIHVRESEDTGAVFIYEQGDVIQWGIVAPFIEESIWKFGKETDEEPAPVAMRIEPSLQSPIAFDLYADTRIIILQEENDGWYHVQCEDGFKGFVEKKHIKLAEIEVLPVVERENVFIPWKPLGGKINLTWEHVVSRTPSTDQIGEMPGLNVISPTWFHLAKDNEGQFYVRNLAVPEYVSWAHERGYQVWALFSNDFDPDLTSEALASYDTRMLLIKQLLNFAEMYDLQGINIDFENVYYEDQALFTQFVREMTPFLHEQGLVVSIDVTIRGGSPMWSLFADRRELGKVVDYMIVMTYDEHWAASPIAGSVASLPWTEKGIVDIMREDDVPASKLILGVPYYTRIWTEEAVDGQVKVSSRAWYMETVQNYIREHGLTPVYLEDVGQHYVEHELDGKTFKIWIEDEVSMRSRIEIVNKYDLAGVASWRRGFETPDIWDVVKETLEQRP